MSLYDRQSAAWKKLDEKLKEAESNHKTLDLNLLIYEFTKEYPVSALAIKKQIIRYAKPRGFEITDDKLVMENVL